MCRTLAGPMLHRGGGIVMKGLGRHRFERTDEVGGASARSRASSGSWRISPADAFSPGRTVDKTYRVLDRIGGGAMTEVLRALDVHADRKVALKHLRPSAMEVPEARKLLIAEARAMSRVRHENVVDIEAVGEWQETPYVVMEYVPGVPLDEWLALREICPPTLYEAFALVDRMCLGVEAVHASGGAFHDLAAGNFLVAPGLRAVVSGLGGSHTLAALRGDDAHTVRTPATIAPEVVLRTAETGGLPADVYAVGVLAYRLLVGRYPFDHDDALETMALHASEPPPSPCALRPELPRTVEPVLLSPLAKAPSDRTASVRELRLGLRAARKAAARVSVRALPDSR